MYVKLSLPDSVTCTAIIILMLVKLNVYDARNNARNNIINIQNLRVDTESVKNALNTLKMIYSPGPDGNHSLLLKKCYDTLGHLLARLFQLSFNECKIPEIWKTSCMTPLLKKSDRNKAPSYRGITSLCATSKVLELIIIHQKLLNAFMH